MPSKDLKEKLAYICKNKCGYFQDLQQSVVNLDIEKFLYAGFIIKDNTMKNETWHKTKLAGQYYKNMYGRLVYLKLLLFNII